MKNSNKEFFPKQNNILPIFKSLNILRSHRGRFEKTKISNREKKKFALNDKGYWKRDSKFLGNFFIFFRYLILLALMFSLQLIYFIFTPLTVYPSAILLKLFFSKVIITTQILDGTSITLLIINLKSFIQIIPACIAGSAYLLLLILNLTVSMDLKKRIYSIILSFAILLLFNILRIVTFSIFYYNKFSIFDFTHTIIWYFLSTLFVILIWFFMVKIFSIKEIPIYSDIKLIIKGIKKK